MYKEINYGESARNQIKHGVDALADVVKVTLGPMGKNVILERDYGGSKITKDGVTVAREVSVRDPLKRIGSELIKDVAFRTVSEVGDGTTTACVLAQAIFNRGLGFIQSEYNSMAMRRGIKTAAAVVVSKLQKYIRIPSDEDLRFIARVSANNDADLGDVVYEAIKTVGEYGFVNIEESRNSEIVTEYLMGMEFKRGLISPMFVNTNRATCELEDPLILIMDYRATDLNMLIDITNEITKLSRSIVIIAEDFSDIVVNAFAVNNSEGTIRCALVRAPGNGERIIDYLKDIAVMTGGTVYTKMTEGALKRIEDISFGSCEKILITRDSTRIIEGHGDKEKINEYTNGLQELAKSDALLYEQNKLKERIASMKGGVATIKVGAKSFVEMQEVKDRIDDSVHATQAAIKHGIVPGGGIPLFLIGKESMSDLQKDPGYGDGKYTISEKIGSMVVYEACQIPAKQILENAGLGSEFILSKIYEKNVELNADPILSCFGYDPLSESYCDFYTAGILDPAKVVIATLDYASSVAALLLTSEAVIFNDEKSRTLQEESEARK